MHPAGALFKTPGNTFSRACRDLSIDTPVGRWNMLAAQPAPDLSEVVDCYWEGWGEIAPLVEKIMPRTCIELMFSLKGRHRVLEMDGKKLDSRHDLGWLSGLQRRYLLIETFDGSHFISARLKPWGAWRLLREPMKAVSGRVPLIDELWGDGIRLLTERLAAAPNAFARFDLLENDLRRRLDQRARPDRDIVEATRRLRRSHGLVRIDSLCRELGTSRATLSRKFGEQVGLAPKTYARVVRISALMQRLAQNGPDDWAMLAEDFGYHDQAHLIHDFQEFCGATPAEFLRRATADGGATLEDPPVRTDASA
jgi:AraC-like DNA-binding protein